MIRVQLPSHSSRSAEELIRACAESSDSGAWNEFLSRFERAIKLSVRRTADQWGQAPQEVVDDLVQETYLKLCADHCQLLLKFAIQHPDAISGYIKTIAINVAHDYFKALRSKKRGSGVVDQLLEDTDSNTFKGGRCGPEAMEREVLLKEIDQCLETYCAGPDRERDCLIFWLHYRQGMSAKAISGLPLICLTEKGVDSAIQRLTKMVREHLAGRKSQEKTEGTPGEKGIRPAESY